MPSKEYEKSLLILYSLSNQNNKATKKEVLDYVVKNNLIKLSNDDLQKRESNGEIVWRSSLAYIRHHLVTSNYLNNSERGYWETTKEGKIYFDKLAKKIVQYPKDSFNLLSGYAYETIAKIFLSTKAESELIEKITEDIKSYDNEEMRFEGEAKTRMSNYYERDPLLRKLAIEYHGFNCKACNFNYYDKYGDRGKYYIEVHHLFPVSKLDGAKEINYKTDMTVLCANCHRIIHRKRDEVLTLDELKKIITSN